MLNKIATSIGLFYWVNKVSIGVLAGKRSPMLLNTKQKL